MGWIRPAAALPAFALRGPATESARPCREQRPANAKEALAGSFDRFLFGDFKFRPFPPGQPGVMRFGCVNSAANVKVVERR